ncbi:MAG: hypothetical protein WCT24_03225 [Patescibacteria group bacterium]|jgi:hypothetical protein
MRNAFFVSARTEPGLGRWLRLECDIDMVVGMYADVRSPDSLAGVIDSEAMEAEYTDGEWLREAFADARVSADTILRRLIEHNVDAKEIFDSRMQNVAFVCDCRDGCSCSKCSPLREAIEILFPDVKIVHLTYPSSP